METFCEKRVMVQTCLRTTDLDDSTIVQSGMISRPACTSESACVWVEPSSTIMQSLLNRRMELTKYRQFKSRLRC